jgi:putative hemolysin
MIPLILLVLGILILSGFFSGSESALVSLNASEVETLVRKRRLGSAILKKVYDQLGRVVMTILVFNNIVNIVGSIAVGQMVIALYGDAVLAVVTTGLTFGIIIFSEIIPKSIALHYAESFSLIVAPIMYVLTVAISPLVFILEKITNIFKRGTRKEGTEDQIRSLVTIGRRAGHIETDEGKLIHRAFVLNDKKAKTIMTPIKDVISLRNDIGMEDAVDKTARHPYSRYPVFGESMDDVKGIIIDHDLFKAYYDDKKERSIDPFIRDPLVVSADMHSGSLLQLFRDTKTHLAIVQENEKTIGIVTLEDVLEELVGEIEDETDE